MHHDVPAVFAGHDDPSVPIAPCLKDLDLIEALIREAGTRYGMDVGDMTVCKVVEEDAGVDLRVPGNWLASWKSAPRRRRLTSGTREFQGPSAPGAAAHRHEWPHTWRVSVTRTARRLMECRVLLPASRPAGMRGTAATSSRDCQESRNCSRRNGFGGIICKLRRVAPNSAFASIESSPSKLNNELMPAIRNS